MPSLNARRQVRYTQTDLNAIDGALAVLEFIKEFDSTKAYDSSNAIQMLCSVKNFIAERRKQPTKPA